MSSFKFSKDEKLKSRKVIQQLFEQRKSILIFPLRLIWAPITPRFNKYPAQFAVTVPKRSFPKAVDRNRIKRLIREAYRLGKPLLYEQLSPFEEQYALMFIYTGKKEPSLRELQKSVKRIRKKIVKQLAEEKGIVLTPPKKVKKAKQQPTIPTKIVKPTQTANQPAIPVKIIKEEKATLKKPVRKKRKRIGK